MMQSPKPSRITYVSDEQFRKKRARELNWCAPKQPRTNAIAGQNAQTRPAEQRGLR